jgi:hypothetical protein
LEELPSGWDERYAYKDVMRELEKYRNGMKEDVETIRDIEVQRLDALFLVSFGQAREGNLQAIDRCLRIMERRANLLGLDKPAELKIGGIEGAPPIREVIIERVHQPSENE